MKVALAAWAPFLAGAEVALERLAVGLQEAGHDVLMIVGSDGEALQSYRRAGLHCEHVAMHTSDKWTFWRSVRMQRQLEQVFRRESPDVVHANDLPTGQMIGAAARRGSIPRVCHHRWAFDAPAIDWLNKHGAELHLFVSRYLKDDLCGKSAKLAASPCRVVYDGLPLPPVPDEPSRTAARQELGLPQDKSIVLFAGQMIERKGVADALHAWAKIAAQFADQAEFHLVGDDLESAGAYRRQMEQLAQQVGGDARFHGFRRDVPTWLRACDFVLVPSHVEPLGNATLEAMAHGRPVVGCDVGGIPEMIEDNQTGLLVPAKSPDRLATAISRLLTNPDERATLGQAARVRCEQQFSLAAHVQSVLKEYEQVLPSHAKAASR